eukprot:COSAG02_NODE_1314_length_13316_cov_55.343800_6_plen_82_part_00
MAPDGAPKGKAAAPAGADVMTWAQHRDSRSIARDATRAAALHGPPAARAPPARGPRAPPDITAYRIDMYMTTCSALRIGAM